MKRPARKPAPKNATAEELRTAKLANITVPYLRRMRREGSAPRVLVERVSFISGDDSSRLLFGKRWAEEPDPAGMAATIPADPAMRFNWSNR
jgi:hypothetical protein